MDNNKTSVDFEYVSKARVTHYTYMINRLVLNTSVSIIVMLHSDKDQSFHRAFDMTVEGEEYRKWGNDDSYIHELIVARIGLFCAAAAAPPAAPPAEPPAETPAEPPAPSSE